MKKLRVLLLVLAASLLACSEVAVTGTPPACQHEANCTDASDCDCPDGYTASCVTDQCLCLTAEESQECYPLTRGEFVDQLVRKLINLDEYVPPETPSYPDVPADNPYYAAIEAATELGIIQAYPNGYFEPENQLNRAEGTKIVIVGINGLDNYVVPATPTYLDVAPGDWYFDHVEAATQLDLTHGYVNQDGSPTGYFGPGDLASSCFMDAMMAHAKFPQISADEITITIGEINYTNMIAVEGEADISSVKYRVFYTSADHPLNDLTVINQPDGEQTASLPTLGIEWVFVSCTPPSGFGNWSYVVTPLVDGVAQFSNLNCYDETGNGLEVDVGYDVAHISLVGDILSGQVFRLVLDDDRLAESQAEVPMGTVRRTRLYFANAPMNSTLYNGENTLYKVEARAHVNGFGSLARLVFETGPVDADSGDELRLNYFRLYRGSTLVNTSIFDGNLNDLTGSSFLTGPEIVVSFLNEETIAPGTTQTYTLKAMVSGVEQNDWVATALTPLDDDLPVTGKTGDTTPNTAKIVSSIDSVGLFINTTYFQAYIPSDRNVIWSDWSASSHAYGIADGTSSYDWTNGYRLGVGDLMAVTLTNN